MLDHSSHWRPALAAALAGLVAAGAAQAQTMNANAASYNGGYGRSTDQTNQLAAPAGRNANGDLVRIAGATETGPDYSGFSNAGVGGAFDRVAGVGASGAATAFGGLAVTTQRGAGSSGADNSFESNSGSISVTSSLSGGVNNDQ